jgi:hypothetical protein
VPDSPDSACPLHLRPIVVSSPNCSARDRRLCLRCNLASCALPAQSRRRLQHHRWYRRLHQGWTLVLNQLHPLPLPLPPLLLTTGLPHCLYPLRLLRYTRTYADLCTVRSNYITRPFPSYLPSLRLGLLLLRGLARYPTCPPPTTSTKLSCSCQLASAVH